MNRRTTVVVAAIAGVGVGVATTLLVTHEKSEPSARTAMSERKVLYWHDPMVPGTKFDKPGKSPFMDMQLVPVYADSEAGPAVDIPSSVAQSLGIRVGTVERKSFSTALNAVGNVAFDERRIEVVQARVSGTIRRGLSLNSTRKNSSSRFDVLKNCAAARRAATPGSEWSAAV